MSTQSYERLERVLRKRAGAESIAEIAKRGMAYGVRGFIYDYELTEMYDEYKDALWDVLCDMAQAYGYTKPLALVAGCAHGDINTETQFKAQMVWIVLEYVARRIVERESDI